MLYYLKKSGLQKTKCKLVKYIKYRNQDRVKFFKHKSIQNPILFINLKS